MSLASTAEAHDPLLFYGLAASDSPVPTVVAEGSGAHAIRTVNAAFCRLLGGPAVEHEGRAFAALSREPERVERMLSHARTARTVELVLDVAYLTPNDQPCFASTLVTPVIAGETVGLVLHLFDSTALALARHGAPQAAPDLLEANLRLLVANLHAQELAEASKRQATLFERRLARKSVLAEASALLASSLDYDETVRRLASLALPELADCCAVELRVQDTLEPLALAHVDSSKEQTARTLARTISPGAHVSFGAPQVVRAGHPVLIQDLTHREDVIAELGPERSSMLSKLGARSYLCVPLSARGATIGAFTLIATEPGRELGESELEFARELALHASFALENARLYRDAQQAIAMRDDVLAVVSHDLQSPLNAISMTVRRLLARTDVAVSAGTMRSLDLLQRTARHMYRLLEELLEVGSIQAGQLQLHYTMTDGSALIEEAMVMIEPLAQKKGLRTHVRVERSPLGIRCDEERMLRVVLNLLGNAVKFTSEGGEVTVRAEIVGNDFLLTVRDTGPGIARVDLPKLFEPYWKGHRSGRSGMGLGLYIARGVVQAHRGRIWVESEVGVGSTFRVCLPVDAGESETSACSTNAR